MAIDRPEVAEIFDRESTAANQGGSKEAIAIYALYIYTHTHFTCIKKGKVLRDNECDGVVRSLRAAFKQGTIGDYWKTIEPENQFDPEFRKFIDNEITNSQSKHKTMTA